METISCKLPKVGKRYLQKLSQEGHRSLSNQIRYLILQGLQKTEQDFPEDAFFPQQN